jgi:tRNA A-37 threonylcarbamoyl transferase component Bud32
MAQPAQPEQPQQPDLQRACAELERRLRGGQPCTAEDLFAVWPALAAAPEPALELVYTEFVVREQLGQRPQPADWYARFPQWRGDLEQLFQVHRAVGSTGRVATLPHTEPATGLAGAEPGQHLGPYELLGEVGRGGMGVVYKARQAGVDRLVAIKVILAAEHSGPHERARFFTEAAAAGSLQHPNIVQIYDMGEEAGRPFLVLEWMAGKTLAATLAGTPWPVREAARLIETLARAMQHAHEQGVVHRDLKPGNILLSADGTPKIADFGLARRVPSAEADTVVPRCQTTTGAILGTPSYMAPEQAAGANRAVGPGTDVYALGAILYELLTGRPPFCGSGLLETLEQVRSQEPVPPRRLQPRLRRDLDTICLKCLHKAPGQRYGSALELAEDLRRFLAHEPIHARPTTLGERLVKWAKRRPGVAFLLATVVVSVAVGVGFSLWSWQQTLAALEQTRQARDDERQQRQKAEAALAAQTILLARQSWRADQLEDTRRLLEVCPPEYRDRDWYYLQRACTGCLRTIVGRPMPYTSLPKVVWSPDGALLASVIGRERFKPQTIVLLVWEATSGRLLHTFAVTDSKAVTYELAFTADSRRLVFAGHSGLSGPVTQTGSEIDARVWDLAKGAEIGSISASTPKKVIHVALSRDGRWLGCATLDGFQLWEVASGQAGPSLPIRCDPLTDFTLSPDGQLVAYVDGGLPARTVHLVERGSGRAAGKALLIAGQMGRLVISPDATHFAGLVQRLGVNTMDYAVWDRASGREILWLQPDAGLTQAVAFSGDGRRVATGTDQGAVFVWDLATGKEALGFRGHRGRVSSLDFGPDGQRLASTSQDGTVRIWDVRPLEH